MALVGGASLYYSIYLTQHSPNEAYFVTPVRVWEFALGAIVALAGARLALPKAVAGYASLAGLSMIIAAAVFYGDDTPFPGYLALVPTVGTALVIMAGHRGDRQWHTVVTGSRPVQLVGDVSYSLYLWHWPLILLAPFVLGDLLPAGRLTLPYQLGILGVSLLAAIASKYLVEDTRPHLAAARPPDRAHVRGHDRRAGRARRLLLRADQQLRQARGPGRGGRRARRGRRGQAPAAVRGRVGDDPGQQVRAEARPGHGRGDGPGQRVLQARRQLRVDSREHGRRQADHGRLRLQRRQVRRGRRLAHRGLARPAVAEPADRHGPRAQVGAQARLPRRLPVRRDRVRRLHGARRGQDRRAGVHGLDRADAGGHRRRRADRRRDELLRPQGVRRRRQRAVADRAVPATASRSTGGSGPMPAPAWWCWPTRRSTAPSARSTAW